MKLVKKCLIKFNNKWTNQITKKEINNDVQLRFTLLDMQKFAKYYLSEQLRIGNVSHRRELLFDFYRKVYENKHWSSPIYEEDVDNYLKNNCG